MKFKKFVLIFIITLLIFSGVLLLLEKGHAYLRVNSPVEKVNLIIESWIPFSAVEFGLNAFDAKDYKHIYITGLSEEIDTNTIQKFRKQKTLNKTNAIFLESNGAIYLSELALQKLAKTHKFNNISIFAHGYSSYNIKTFFTVAFKDSVIGSSFASTNIEKYSLEGNFTTSQLRYFNLYYGNEPSWRGTRNLNIDSVAFDKITLKTWSDFVIVPDKDLPNKQRNYPFYSQSQFLKTYIPALGYSIGITTVDTLYTGRNKTRAMAHKFALYSEKQRILCDTFNIMSYYLHSRRSDITYRYFLTKARIGTICYYETLGLRQNFFRNAYLITEESTSIFINKFYK